MKRVVVYLALGLGVMGFLFAGGLRTEIQLTPAAQENLARLGQGTREVERYVKSWLRRDEENVSVAASTEEETRPASLDVNYDAALEIVDEILEDLGNLFTSDQKQEIEKRVNQLYKQQVLREYKDQLSPSYYE